MLSPDLLLRLISQRKCLRSAVPLSVEELLISRSSFPHLFRGEFAKDEADFIGHIFARIVGILPLVADEGRTAIRGFMQEVLRNGKIHSEEFLHRYLFEFWDDTWMDAGDGFSLCEKFYKCKLQDGVSAFAKSVVPRVYLSGQNIPDIIGISGKASKCVYVIEIKNEPLDDRALGQILRYYQVVRTVCDKHWLHGSVKRVIPVLVVPEGSLSFWESVPFHFREVLEILYWRLNSHGAIELVDGKAVLRQISGSRVFVAS
jgi:hypothetical protein